MTNTTCSRIRNAGVVAVSNLPVLPYDDFRAAVLRETSSGARLAALFCPPPGDSGSDLTAVLVHEAEGWISLWRTEVRDSYPALTPECMAAHWFEREIAEQWAITPEGHPWLKPLRFHTSYTAGRDAWNREPGMAIPPSVTDFFQMGGEEIHEVAVGPVHAGIIEPGHFRFQCYGEQVFHLEISLGYQHRGIESALRGGPDKRTIHYMETAAGDTSAGHALTYCQAVEALAGCKVPPRAHALRALALELERLANHTGDLGALANDVGYLPTSSFCGRIRGEFLNLTALLCGNRFGRGFVIPGGTAFDIDEPVRTQLADCLRPLRADLTEAVRLLWNTSSVRARFENAGFMARDIAESIGLVGVPARACGIKRDVRVQFPTGFYSMTGIPIAVCPAGNVYSRALVRWQEIEHSLSFLEELLYSLPHGAVTTALGPLAPGSVAVSLAEGWRGEICHVISTDKQGRFAHYKIVDPSFHNWMGLAIALRGQQISDFPLCNKSFNLSYCGHDL
jgi:Ni,Fe-hydrogenase III large subunit